MTKKNPEAKAWDVKLDAEKRKDFALWLCAEIDNGIGGCVVFKNDRKKEGSNAPDWRILKPQPKEERDIDQRRPAANVPETDIDF